MNATSEDRKDKDSSCKQSGRKRQLEEVVRVESSTKSSVDNLTATIQDASIMDTTSDVNNDGPPKLCGLRLEAIFHPKFENETRTNKDIRNKMKERVSCRKGYLEVSLKHSGSLLLWSGGQRFYSKNATENQFTHVGEIELRQHFYRAWWDTNNTTSDQQEQAYKECSDYVEQHRLTLAFELVTDVLGHHGAIPHRDFLILTAVASKREERFYSTVELVQLAQRFRLPHNDSWVFCSTKSVDALFDLYDTTRETGMARDTISKLTKSADAHVCSMYPHEVFQGDILEGIVIRYVSYGNDTEKEHQLGVLKQLAGTSEEILVKVPPERPPCFELLASQSTDSNMPSVLTTNIRTIFHECMKHQPNYDEKDEQDQKQDGKELFAAAVQDILEQSDGGQRRTVQRWSPKQKKSLQGHLPSLVTQLLENNPNSLDAETKRIAKMIATLDSLKQRAEYKVLHETRLSDDRWLCVVHIYWDTTFQKFHKNKEQGDMPLFRGCCLELVTDQDTDMHEAGDVTDQIVASENGVGAHMNNGDDDSDDTLMLKMKFLPYMVRTFGCRNGLNALKTGGPAAFDNFTMNLMSKWGISEQAIAKYRPFFHAWGVYAYPLIQGQTEATDGSLLPLNNIFYLDHLERFSEMYYSGKLESATTNDTTDETTFRGLVIVVALEKEVAQSYADHVAQALGGVRQCNNVNRIKDQDLITSRLPAGGGLVCTATVDDSFKNVRKHLKKFGDSISVVLVGCDEESVVATETEGANCTGRLGKVSSLRKTRCNVLEISTSVDNPDEGFSSREDIQKMLANLLEKSNAMAMPDMRPGLLVLFPGIPGCGKSSICSNETSAKLEQITKDLAETTIDNKKKRGPVRKVTMFEGDKLTKKYWPFVKQERGMEPSSICVADKNVPPSAWSTVGNVCASTRGVAVSVLPDDVALTKTTITGAFRSDGSFNANIELVYPFSLHYLAVCMARVLRRPHGSHSGKLDSSTDGACMIVAKFFAWYKNIDAEQLSNRINSSIEASGAMTPLPPIRVPFFDSQNLPPLPSEFEAALKKALQIQTGLDRAEKESHLKKEADELEKDLQSLLKKHDAMLQGLTVDEKESRKSFLEQAEARIKELDSQGTSAVGPLVPPSSFIKIVSIDLGVDKVHEVLRTSTNSSPSIASFLEMACGDPTAGRDSLSGNNFVKNTHVTMAHFSEMPQDTIHQQFDSVKGHSVDISVTGFLWNDSVAALSVSVSPMTNDEKQLAVPSPFNSFAHITVWYQEGASAVLSNQLPSMVKDGKAEQIDFDEPITLQGQISYWSESKSSSSS